MRGTPETVNSVGSLCLGGLSGLYHHVPAASWSTCLRDEVTFLCALPGQLFLVAEFLGTEKVNLSVMVGLTFIHRNRSIYIYICICFSFLFVYMVHIYIYTHIETYQEVIGYELSCSRVAASSGVGPGA